MKVYRTGQHLTHYLTRANPLCVKQTQCGRRGAVWSRGEPWTGLLEVRSLIILPLLLAIVLQATLLVSLKSSHLPQALAASTYNLHPSSRRRRGVLPELSMVLQSSSRSGPAFGPSVAAMEPASVLPPLPPPPLLPLPTLKLLSPPLSTNCKDS